MKNIKAWNVIAWISFVMAGISTVIYFFVDENYIEAPSWLIASVASWFYCDHLAKSVIADSGDDSLGQLEKYGEMLGKGILTQEEFDAKKKVILNS